MNFSHHVKPAIIEVRPHLSTKAAASKATLDEGQTSLNHHTTQRIKKSPQDTHPEGLHFEPGTQKGALGQITWR